VTYGLSACLWCGQAFAPLGRGAGGREEYPEGWFCDRPCYLAHERLAGLPDRARDWSLVYQAEVSRFDPAREEVHGLEALEGRGAVGVRRAGGAWLDWAGPEAARDQHPSAPVEATWRVVRRLRPANDDPDDGR
jgi:hypothetical protein